jgi:hypothetical protein
MRSEFLKKIFACIFRFFSQVLKKIRNLVCDLSKKQHCPSASNVILERQNTGSHVNQYRSTIMNQRKINPDKIAMSFEDFVKASLRILLWLVIAVTLCETAYLILCFTWFLLHKVIGHIQI